MKADSTTDGGKSQGGASNLTDRGGARRGGDPGRSEEMNTPGDTAGLEGQGGTAGSQDEVEAWARKTETEENCGEEEPVGPKGWKDKA